MKSRTVLIVIFGIIIFMIFMVLWNNLARGKEIPFKPLMEQRLVSREEQIQIMEECLIDVKKTKGVNYGYKNEEIAIAFFYYRMGARPYYYPQIEGEYK